MLEDPERDSEYVGMDFDTPLPLADIAQAVGVASAKVDDPNELRETMERAIGSGKPSVIDVSIDGSL